MALNNTFAIVDVVDFAVMKASNKDLLFTVDYATSVGFSTTSERLDIRGGLGAPIRVSADHSRTGEFTSELPLVDINALGVKLGKLAVKGAATAPMLERLQVAKSSKVTLKQTPETGTLKVYVLASNGRDIVSKLTADTTASAADKYAINGKEITVHNTITEGTYLRCVYDYTSGANTQLVRVTADDFPFDVRITGRGYGKDESGNIAPVAFIVHRAKPTPDFEMTFANGQATNINFNCTMLATLIDNEMAFYDIIPLSDETF
jgi:hypothetical protein